MKLWLDDVRPAPEGYKWIQRVNSAIDYIETMETLYRHGDIKEKIELLDLDHDAGEYACCGGDYIKILDWMESTGRNYPIRIHSQNVVGVQNMRRIIQRNNWKEVF